MITPSFGLTATERVLPRLALDFTTGDLDPRITFTRADATATQVNSSGNLEVVSADVARLPYDPSTLSRLGLLVEEARTNSIRNNTMQGAAVSPFTPPTNWGIPAVSGLTQSITALGTENGIDYIDIRLVGTGTGAQVISFETTTGITVVNGETWATSFYCKLVGGSLANVVHLKPRVTERTSAGGFVVAATGDAFTPTGANLILQRQSYVRTLSGGATVARLQPGIEYSVDGAVDFTIRVGLPQCEKGGTVTTPIKTSTVAVTRNNDISQITGTNFSDWFNATEGTFAVESLTNDTLSTTNPYVLTVLSDGSNRITMHYLSSERFLSWVRLAGVASSSTISSVPRGVRHNATYGYKTGDSGGSLDGNAIVLSSPQPTGIPTVTFATLGYYSIGGPQNFLNGYLRKIYYWPHRLTDAEIRAFSK